MEDFDLGYWVRSPEISAHLQSINWGTTTEEQAQLVLNAHRPLKEKTDALWKLQRFAESAEERELVKAMWNLYRFSLKEIRESKPGDIYRRKQADERESHIQAFPSWQVLMDETAKIGAGRWVVEKHCPASEGFAETVAFSLEWVDGQLCEVEFYLDEDVLTDASLREALAHKNETPRHLFIPAAIEEILPQKEGIY